MNTSHYPSLELCKKLTDIGFPETTEYIISNGVMKKPSEVEVTYQGHYYDEYVRITKKGEYLCPSVMEMLDVMPREITLGELNRYILNMSRNGAWYYNFTDNGHPFIYKETEGALPNALAEMILWLHENNYISFSK